MPSAIRPHRIFALAVLVPVLFAGDCKKQPDPLETTQTITEDPQSIALKLQVVSIDPSTVEPNKDFTGTVYGSAFSQGARVTVDGKEATGVVVTDENTIQLNVPGFAAGVYDVTVINPAGEETTLRQGLMVKQNMEDCRSVRVQYDFDSSSLTSSDRATMEGKVNCYQSGSGPIRVEGHADARGTTEYNLALGQRRAEAVKRLLSAQGINPGRLSTISYGEEKPLDMGVTEDAWAMNRRADVYASE